jgi:hypothetical protein
MNAEVLIAAAELAAVVIGITAIWLNLRALRDQLRTHTFIEYTGRYARIWENLPAAARSRRGGFDTTTLSPAERVQLTNVVRGYLNLCSEEYWLYQKKRIDRGTWDIWKLGIIDTVKLPWFRASWDELRDEYRYYHDFIGLMNECFETSAEAAADSFAESVNDP